MAQPLDCDPSILLSSVSQLQARPVDWLWPWRLALGKPAILEGDPGLGKSLVALDLCARLSRGLPFPDGSAGPGPANALILSAEDNNADTIAPRLTALGADLERVFVLHRERREARKLLSLPTVTAPVEEALVRTGARLVVIDPITSFLDRRVNLASDPSVRAALEPLEQLAEKYAVAVWLIRHLNKNGGRRALYRGLGSIAFVAACRSAWLAAAVPGEAGRCVLAQVKNNLAAAQPSLVYVPQTEESGQVGLTWQGTSTWTAEQLQAAAARPAVPGPRERAGEFLHAFLKDGPHTTREILAAARQQRLTARTLRRAKRDLEVRSVRAWAGGQRLSYWLLPDQELPEGVTQDEIIPELEPWLKPLRDQYERPKDPLEGDEPD